MRRFAVHAITGLLAVTGGSLVWPAPASAAPNTTILVSVSSSGVKGNEGSGRSALASNGSIVAFESHADNLVADDTNRSQDIFVRDLRTGLTTRVSVAGDGGQANGYSYAPALSADGRYVAFESYATNLVANDTNRRGDVFRHDVLTGATVRVSLPEQGFFDAGGMRSSISADGNRIAFSSDGSLTAISTSRDNVYVRDVQAGVTTLVGVAPDGSAANNYALSPHISADGNTVVFGSEASNLVPGDTNNACDVFARDLRTGTTTRVSVATGGAQSNGSYFTAVSGDGRYVAFLSDASDLVPGDTNDAYDAFLHDRQTNVTTRVSVGAGGVQLNAEAESVLLSPDARHVMFDSKASNVVTGDTNQAVDVFVLDRTSGAVTRVSVAGDARRAPPHQVICRSTASRCAQAQGSSAGGGISADGSTVVFDSEAGNLVPRDPDNGPLGQDVFVRRTGA